MKVVKSNEFPAIFLNESQDLAWPTIVNSEHNDTALLITIDSKSSNPIALFASVGNKAMLAKAINQIIFNDEELALALLAELSADPQAMTDLMQAHSSN